MKEKMKPVRGKNSIEIDRMVCDARRVELGLTQEALAEMCGRTGGWYNGLKDKRTTPQAARLLAKALQLDYEDILKSHAPKEERIEAEIACEALRDDLSDENGVIDKSYYNALKNALETNTEALKAIGERVTSVEYQLSCICDTLDRVANVLQRISDTYDIETRL